MSISRKDNSLRGARNLGQLSGNKRVNGLVNSRDRIDFVSFDLSASSNLGLSIGRVAGRSSARITLRNSQGGILQTLRAGSRVSNFVGALSAGRYFIGIQRQSGTVNYRISATATPIAPPIAPTPIPPNPPNLSGEPGQGLSTARDIGILTGTYSNAEFVGTTDPSDLYRFTLTDSANLQARVDSTAAGTRVELIRDGNGNGLIDNDEILASGSDFSAPFQANLTEDLPPGTYFARVLPSSTTASTPYQLNLVATPFGGNISPEPGNTLPTARELGALSGTVTAKEYTGKLDGLDFYRFTLNDISNIQINAIGTSANTRIRLIRDTNGNGLVDNDETVASDTNFNSTFLSSITQDLPAGAYFIGVEPRDVSSSTLYTLNVVATPFGGTLSSDPGNTLPVARDLGVLAGTFTAREHVGILDSVDYYRFTLASPGSLQARVTGSSANTRIQLIRDTNSNGLIDNGEILEDDTNFSGTFLSEFTESLAAGTYFFSVSSRDTGVSTNYLLSLTV
ncbi:pre-peptidase C-terminal domain-containing protein [Leptolyngbya ohadii]|uniref:pre-peptidase C-terminal domain-containing protein n=1 Tax=Leptolyngbya ohadii TaxID=1962290 RepID=UPI000B59A3C8|nr:pre-peptidase C-terminal domain-containing protein [Leptolyngbya ohadii]